MHPSLGRSRTWRACAAATLGVSGLLFVGCSSDQGSSSYRSEHSSAIQASDTSRAPSDSPNHISMAFPTGNRDTSDLLLEETGPREARVDSLTTTR